MRRGWVSLRPICLLLLCLLLMNLLALAQSPQRYRVAVIDFEVTDVAGTGVDAVTLGHAMSIAFETPLVQSQRFTVITRSDLEPVMNELSLASRFGSCAAAKLK